MAWSTQPRLFSRRRCLPASLCVCIVSSVYLVNFPSPLFALEATRRDPPEHLRPTDGYGERHGKSQGKRENKWTLVTVANTLRSGLREMDRVDGEREWEGGRVTLRRRDCIVSWLLCPTQSRDTAPSRGFRGYPCSQSWLRKNNEKEGNPSFFRQEYQITPSVVHLPSPVYFFFFFFFCTGTRKGRTIKWTFLFGNPGLVPYSRWQRSPALPNAVGWICHCLTADTKPTHTFFFFLPFLLFLHEYQRQCGASGQHAEDGKA